MPDLDYNPQRMTNRSLIPRFVAVWITFGLSLPAPALGLRPVEPVQSDLEEELGEALQADTPEAPIRSAPTAADSEQEWLAGELQAAIGAIEKILNHPYFSASVIARKEQSAFEKARRALEGDAQFVAASAGERRAQAIETAGTDLLAAWKTIGEHLRRYRDALSDSEVDRILIFGGSNGWRQAIPRIPQRQVAGGLEEKRSSRRRFLKTMAGAGVGAAVGAGAKEIIAPLIETAKTTPAPWELSATRGWLRPLTEEMMRIERLERIRAEDENRLDEVHAELLRRQSLQFREWTGNPDPDARNKIKKFVEKLLPQAPRFGYGEAVRFGPPSTQIIGGQLRAVGPVWNFFRPFASIDEVRSIREGILSSTKGIGISIMPPRGEGEVVLSVPMALHGGGEIETAEFDEMELGILVPETTGRRIRSVQARLITTSPVPEGLPNYQKRSNQWRSGTRQRLQMAVDFEELVADVRETYGPIREVEIRLSTDGTPGLLEMHLSGWVRTSWNYEIGKRTWNSAKVSDRIVTAGSTLLGAVVGGTVGWRLSRETPPSNVLTPPSPTPPKPSQSTGGLEEALTPTEQKALSMLSQLISGQTTVEELTRTEAWRKWTGGGGTQMSMSRDEFAEAEVIGAALGARPLVERVKESASDPNAIYRRGDTVLTLQYLTEAIAEGWRQANIYPRQDRHFLMVESVAAKVWNRHYLTPDRIWSAARVAENFLKSQAQTPAGAEVAEELDKSLEDRVEKPSTPPATGLEEEPSLPEKPFAGGVRLGGTGSRVIPDGFEGAGRPVVVRYIQTKSIPLGYLGGFSLGQHLSFKIVPMGAEGPPDFARREEGEGGVAVQAPPAGARYDLYVWLNGDWQKLDMIPVEDGVPIVFKRTLLPKELNPLTETDLEVSWDKRRPVSDKRYRAYFGGFGWGEEQRIAIFWEENGLEKRVYLPRQTFAQEEVSRGSLREKSRPGWNLNTDRFLPGYLQQGHLQVEIMREDVVFSDLGSTYATYLNDVRVTPPFVGAEYAPGSYAPLEDTLLGRERSGTLSAADVSMSQSMSGPQPVSAERAHEFPYSGPFKVSLRVNGEEKAPAEFDVLNRVLWVRLLPKGTGHPVEGNSYLSAEEVPVAGQSRLERLGIEASQVAGNYRVTYDPKTGRVRVFNFSAYQLKIEPLSPPSPQGPAVAGGLEEGGIRVETAAEMAARARTRDGRPTRAPAWATHALLIPDRLLRQAAELEPKVLHVYAQPLVSVAAVSVLPRPMELIQMHDLPEDPARLEEALREMKPEGRAVIVLDARLQDRVRRGEILPKGHDLALLVDPARWEEYTSYQNELAALLAAPAEGSRNWVVLLTAGTVVKVTIAGEDYTAIFA